MGQWSPSLMPKISQAAKTVPLSHVSHWPIDSSTTGMSRQAFSGRWIVRKYPEIAFGRQLGGVTSWR
jgi:hypothetical protein